LPNWEDLGGEPPSAAVLAEAADAAVQRMRSGRARELTRVHQLTMRLRREQLRAEKLAWALQQATTRCDANAKKLAHQNQMGKPPTPEQYSALGREMWRVRDLERDLDLAKTKVEATTKELERAESNVQELEQGLAVAREMAQRRSATQARSPRLGANAVARFVWRLLQARPGLWEGIVRNLYLGMRVAELGVWMLPAVDRARWKDESYSELEELKHEGAPLLGDAVRIALRTPWLALVLWTGAWRRSPAARWLPRLKPVWIGVGTAAATLLGGAAGIGQHPTEFQMRALVAASLLTGALAVTGSFKGRRPRRRSRRRKR
jgi:hypothetical protein